MKEKTQMKKNNIPDAINKSINKDFTQVPNNLLRNPEISAKAKTLLLLIMSHSKFFEDPTTDKEEILLDHCKEGPDAIRSGIKELQEAGLLIKQIHRNQNGGKRYIIGSSWKIQ